MIRMLSTPNAATISSAPVITYVITVCTLKILRKLALASCQDSVLYPQSCSICLAKGSARVLRATRLVSLGTLQAANRVVVVADQRRLAETTGSGACRGDSGGPIVRNGPGGYQLLGIVSWSSGALHSRTPTACGGLTAVTPVSEHGEWITARAQDLRRLNGEQTIGWASRPRTNTFDWSMR